MRVLACPDKFRGSLDAAAAARAIAAGARRAAAVVDACPLADGGEGTLAVLAAAFGASVERVEVMGPRGEPTSACFAIQREKKIAIVESAQAIGLGRLPEDNRDPTKTTSYGLGELIRHALDSGATRIVIALGGSATTDGGAGMAQALGVEFVGAAMPITGGDLSSISGIEMGRLDLRVTHTEVVAACDVDNPLFGPRGAALVFAPQKGANDEQTRALDAGLRHLSRLVPTIDPNRAGAGAAGGLGFGLVAFAGARLVSGADYVLDAIDFDSRLREADLVITGEGRLDAQSLGGKLVARVAERARRAGKPVAAIAGQISISGAELGLSDAVALVRPGIDATVARARASELIAEAAADIVAKARAGGSAP